MHGRAAGSKDPARRRGHLDNLLLEKSKGHRVEHHTALPWQETGAFMQRLRCNFSVASLCLHRTQQPAREPMPETRPHRLYRAERKHFAWLLGTDPLPERCVRKYFRSTWCG
jgi:hypothetical protein